MIAPAWRAARAGGVAGWSLTRHHAVKQHGDIAMVKSAGVVIAGLLLFGGAAMAGTPPALYTGQQAAAGAGVYTQNCALCHGADMRGGAGPAVIGQGFASAGSDNTIGSIFSIIAQQMPESAPGSLTHEQDEDVMAYILKANGYPAGSAALVYKDSLSSTAPLVSQVK
jgi:mono/diheme cytochrome c family protein